MQNNKLKNLLKYFLNKKFNSKIHYKNKDLTYKISKIASHKTPPNQNGITAKLQLFAVQMLHIVIRVVGEPLQLYIVCLGAQQSLEQGHHLLEVWSSRGFRLPAVVHDVIELPAAVLWFFQPVAAADLWRRRLLINFL